MVVKLENRNNYLSLLEQINFLVSKNKISTDCSLALIAIINSSIKISKIISQNGINEGNLAANLGSQNKDGDFQKKLDVLADRIIENELRKAKIYAYLSEENEDPLIINNNGSIILVCDPLDGSSNIDTNLTIGTIFSIFEKKKSLLQLGRDQKVAGFFSYGPQTTLLITFGEGVFGFCLDTENNFLPINWKVTIPYITSEYAINSSNQKYWPLNVKNYINDLCLGNKGSRKKDFNMRWTGSLVADAWRIFKRGGIFLYTNDERVGYEKGRLRLLYEAFPVSFLVEQAGGKAIDGEKEILDIIPESLHQRTSLIFGSSEEVNYFKLNKNN